jgi:hypothetical protein
MGQWTNLEPGDIFSIQKSKKTAPIIINQNMPLYKKFCLFKVLKF